MDRNKINTAVVAVIFIIALALVIPKMIGPSGTTKNAVASNSPAAKALKAGLKNGKPTVVIFHSTSCLPCIEIAKIVDEIKPQWDSKVNFVDVLTDQDTDIALTEEYAIDTIPTSIFFDKSGKQIDRYIGVIKTEEFAARFEKMVK